MHKKQIALLIVFSLFLGGLVNASVKYVHSERERISIPEKSREYASEEDLVEMICYEAKYRGGEGVARVEALSEVLAPALDSLEEADVPFDNPLDLREMSEEMRAKMEEMCNSPDPDTASIKVDEYIVLAEEMRTALRGDFSRNLRSLENDLKGRGEELKKEIESELETKGKEMAKEAEEELRRQGEEEGKALEEQLRALGREFEVFMAQGEVGPGAARTKANELSGRISADAETTTFLSNKFNELLQEAERFVGRAMSGEMTPAQIKSRVEQRVPAVVEEIRKFIEEKYRRMGREKEEEIKEKLNKKAEEIGGEEKEKLQRVRDAFQDVDERIESAYEKRITYWDKYEEKSINKRAEIISRAVESHFEEARELIEERKEQIDVAVEEGLAEDFGILSYERLIEDLEKDKEEIIQRLLKSNLTDTDIVSIQREFKDKWNEYREKMEALEVVSAQDAIDKMLEATDWDDVTRRIDVAHRRISRGAGDRRYQQIVSDCERNPEVTTTPQNVRERHACTNCLSLDEMSALIGYLREVLPEVSEKRRAIRGGVSDLRRQPNYLTIREVLDIRDRIIGYLGYFEEIQPVIEDLEREFQKARTEANEKCFYQLNR